MLVFTQRCRLGVHKPVLVWERRFGGRKKSGCASAGKSSVCLGRKALEKSLALKIPGQ